MQRQDFHFDLPAELIAQAPLTGRSDSRLLLLDAAQDRVAHLQFTDLPAQLRSGDLVVFNDTRVMPARLLGEKASGGRIEVLVERVLPGHRVLAQVRASKSPKPGRALQLGADRGAPFTATTLGREADLFLLQFPDDQPVEARLEAAGHVPLPPYIERADDTADRERYQTIYARRPGAVAAPTAGLHFTPAILDALAARGVASAFVTLHVGAGTFQPMRVEKIAEHRMHAERLEISADTVAAIRACRARGGRVVAIGTTVVRALEAAAGGAAGSAPDAVPGAVPGAVPDQAPGQAPEAVPGVPAAVSGETDIFIHPGYRFRVVDAMVTNFHLPESTLLMLVSAFAGRERVLGAYAQAVAERYRFFSYGDAMLILPQPEALAERGSPGSGTRPGAES